MTKSQLREKIFNDMTSEYYQSNLCSHMDNYQYGADSIPFKHTIEEAIFELVDDLATSAIETMDREGVIKEKSTTLN